MTHKMTDEQEAVAKAISSNKRVEGNAVAGSGKTATLVVGASGIPPSRRVLACAFGKANQVALEERLPDFIDCRTFNGLGHGASIKPGQQLLLPAGASAPSAASSAACQA
jgi:hypothetical protein